MRLPTCVGGALLVIGLLWFLQREVGPNHASEELRDDEFRQYGGEVDLQQNMRLQNGGSPFVSMAQYRARWEKIYQDNWKRTTDYVKTRYDGNFDQVIPWNFNEATYFWDFFPPAYNCDEKERVGRLSDGGKWVCRFRNIERLPRCNILSFGINGKLFILIMSKSSPIKSRFFF